MKYLIYILFIALTFVEISCSPVAMDYPQIHADPAIGNSLRMPLQNNDVVYFVGKNNFVVKGQNNEGVPTIMFGIRF